MSKQRLFILEFFISKIKIDKSALPVPSFRSIGINLSSPPFLNTTIKTEEFDGGKDVQASNGEFKTEIGKNVLFPSRHKDLANHMHDKPLKINLLVSNKHSAVGEFPWRKDFLDTVKLSETVDVVKSVSFADDFAILNAKFKKAGFISMTIKLSCIGDKTETYLNLQGPSPVFINADNLQQIKCDKYNFGDDKIHPVSQLYSVEAAEDEGAVMKYSWGQLVGNKADVKSLAPDADATTMIGPSVSRQKHIDMASRISETASLVHRPPEKKFFDFINMMAVDMDSRPDETVVNIAFDRKKQNLGVMDAATRMKIKMGSLLSVDGELTEDRLCRKLCRKCDCEGLQKFHEHGLGPRYRESGLGKFYEICEPSTTYGMYNVFEDLSRYGPQNFYRRPKDPYQKFCRPASRFHGPQRIKKNDLCYCPPLPDKAMRGEELCCCCPVHVELEPKKRLRGGCDAENSTNKQRTPLRLRGGGIIEKSDEEISFKPWHPSITDIIKKIVDQASL
ncbi:unnamed protein product [Phyllotreta striolata]|uniref:Uncharacterized protein n=1 Tax=Phyllotreta striolata TaxID=444603 RepID=A0A9N9TWI9_PHYSR|nr:unnamed protein product [Phyllotreta striolata]